MSFSDDLLSALPSARACARKLAGQESDDVLQEAVARAIAACERYEAGTNMRAWLSGFVRNVWREDRKKAWRTEPMDERAADLIPARDDAQKRLEAIEAVHAIMSLPPRQRSLIERAAMGYTAPETAVVLGIKRDAAEQALKRGRAALRERFGSEMP